MYLTSHFGEKVSGERKSVSLNRHLPHKPKNESNKKTLRKLLAE
jgi:hypothetical protein